MEQMRTDHLSGENELEIDSHAGRQLSEAAKWARFIAITVFAICGLLLLMVILAASIVENAFDAFGGYGAALSASGNKGALISVIVIIGLIVSGAYYLLFDFGNKTKVAVSTEDHPKLTGGLKSLRIFFVITTVLSILGLLRSLSNMGSDF